MRVDQLPGWSNQTNPYNALLCDALVRAGCTVRDYSLKALIRSGAPEILHVHWPEYGLSQPSAFRARLVLAKLFAGVRIVKARGGKVVWTAHNLRPHERMYPGLEETFYRRWIAACDGVVALSSTASDAVMERYPDLRQKPNAVIRHGDYRPRLSGKWDRASARAELGLDANTRIMASVGAVRPYKNLPALASAFRAWAGPEDRLIIAGKANSEQLAEETRKSAENDGRILVVPEFLSDERMELFCTAADWLVFPYRDILNSGSALFSLSCGRPVLAPAIGSLPELREDVGAGWVRLYEGEFGPHSLELIADAPSGAPDLTLYDWDAIGRATFDFYREVRHGK